MSHACTGKQFAQVLRLFKNSGWQDLHLPEGLRTARAWHLAVRRDIEEHDQFEHNDVAVACGIEHECLILSIRRDLPGTLLQMISEGPGSLHFWAAKEFARDGERIFDALWNGERWLKLQVRAHVPVPDTMSSIRSAGSACL